MRRHCFRPILFLSLLALVWSSAAFAQRTSASLRGTVTDPSGSLVEGATATVINAETGVTRSQQTNEAGIYNFADLLPGPYVLQVERDGFSVAVVENLLLNVADRRVYDVTLTVGEINEEVTVQASTLQVETVGGEVAGLITGEQVRELPLNGRNFVQLTQLMPGVSTPEGFDNKNKGLLAGVDMSVSGGSATGNLWTVDGANNNDVGSNRTILVYPSVDAIEEMKVHRNSYGAEFGGAGGAQINMITRGGTNEWKGSLFYFNRSDSLAETNYFLDQAGLDKEPLDRDDYGYTIGGPIATDKLHFFLSQEWNDETRGIVRSGFVPTLAERSGDFSAGGIAGCSPGAPVDPLTGQPFPGNVIPSDRLSPGGLAFLGLYPLPNVTPTDGSCNNWIEAVPTGIEWEQINGRLDWNPTEKARLMVRYTDDTWLNSAPNAGEANGLWGDDAFPVVDSAWDQPGHSLVVQLNQTISDSAINTLQYSYSGNSISIERGGTNPGLNAEINANIPTLFGDKTGGADRSHPVFWGGQGYAPLWNIAPWENEQDLSILKNDYERVFGDHTLKIGALYSDNSKLERIGGASAFESPQFWGAAGINGWGATSGNVLADFLIEDMTFGFSENQFQPAPELEWQDLEVYISNSWQISDNVTLDAGVRYSRFFAPEASNNQIASFDPNAFDPSLGGDPCNGLLLPPDQASACADAGFLGGAVGPNNSLVNDDTDNFAPRLGLAWDVFGDGRTAIRAGFGQFFQRDRVNIQLEFAGSPPFTSSQSGIRRLDDSEEPCGGCFAFGAGVPTRGFDIDAETPYNLQWNLMWEQRIGDATTFELGYVGSRGVHLARRSDLNQVPAGDANGNGVSDRLEYIQASGNPGAQAGLRPFGVFGDAQILYWENDGKSEYHSLQSQFVHRFGNGGQFQASYTWSDFKANDPLTDSGAGTFDGQILDRDNPDLDYGYAGLHREHVFNASLIYALPSLEGSSDFVRALFGDWQIGTVVVYSSGTALTVNTGTIPGLSGGPTGTGFTDNQRPNFVGGCGGSGGEQILNPNAFSLTGFQLGTPGNLRPGECEGPDFFQVDLSFYKNIRLSQRFEAQLRFEIFNLFDEVNFTGVNTDMNLISATFDGPVGQATQIVDYTPAGNFGRATGARDPRQIQLGLKILF